VFYNHERRHSTLGYVRLRTRRRWKCRQAPARNRARLLALRRV
jgi:hypothetical protein